MFEFKGISSSSMDVYVEEIDQILTKASQRVIIEEIEGYDGSFETNLGYNRISCSLSISVMKADRIDEIKSWLNGIGLFKYKGRVSNVSIFDEVEVSRMINGYKLHITVVRDPFWVLNDGYISYSNSFINEGNIDIDPFIKLTKTTASIVELSINDIRFKYDFKDDEFVEIDCKLKTASMDNLRRNRNLEIGFEFPKAKVGVNNIVFHTGESIVEIKRKDAWL